MAFPEDFMSKVASMLDEGMTLEQIAEKLGWQWDGENLWVPGLQARAHGDAHVYYPDDDDPWDVAEDYASAYEQSDETYWVTVEVWRQGYTIDSDGDLAEVMDYRGNFKCDIQPEEPKCIDEDGHEWCSPLEVVGGIPENPGVQAHGGGAFYTEVCRRCGYYRIVDTWAQDPVDGVCGLKSTEYREPDDRSLAWVERQNKN